MFPNYTRSALFLFAATGLFGLALAGTADAQSVQSQCSTKYQAAKTAGTLNGQSWHQFYSACAAELKAGTAGTQPAAAAPPPAAPPTTATAPAETPPPAAAAPKPRKAAAAPAAPAAEAPAPQPTGPIVFPTAISPQYSTLTPHMQRLKTCDDQYKANKATNSNGGLKWTQKGGGYYSECNKKLKG